jgi:hypothetical protein
MEEVRATLEVRQNSGVWADLRIVNSGASSAYIHNPGDYRPTDGWAHSREAYNAAVLLSFQFLEVALIGRNGTRIEPGDVATRANHDLHPPVELRPSESLTISIPLHEFYKLERGAIYSIEITYGEKEPRIRARGRFQCLASPSIIAR